LMVSVVIAFPFIFNDLSLGCSFFFLSWNAL
jgi:hypothetical protein